MTRQKAIEIAQCPFCGSNEVGLDIDDEAEGVYRVRCRCFASGEPFNDRERAISAWNHRADFCSDSVRELVKKLRNSITECKMTLFFSDAERELLRSIVEGK